MQTLPACMRVLQKRTVGCLDLTRTELPAASYTPVPGGH